jgi:hypothetical protein
VETEVASINTIKTRTGGNFGQADGESIRVSLNRIAAFLEEAGESAVPPTHVTWKTRTILGDPIGEEMEASPLSLNAAGYAGSAPYQESRLWLAVNRRGYTYVRGHLLNHHLFGPGSNQNLVPIHRTLNTTMSARVEEPIKAKVLSERKVCQYKVVVNYSPPWPARINVPAESSLPRSLTLRAVVVEQKDGKWDDVKETIFNSTLPNSLPDDTPVGTRRTLVRLSLNNPGASDAEKLEALGQLPNIGGQRAQALLVELGNGRFGSWSDLAQRVNGVTDTLVATWQAQTVTIPDPARPGSTITRRLIYFDGDTQWANL